MHCFIPDHLSVRVAWRHLQLDIYFETNEISEEIYKLKSRFFIYLFFVRHVSYWNLIAILKSNIYTLQQHRISARLLLPVGLCLYGQIRHSDIILTFYY